MPVQENGAFHSVEKSRGINYITQLSFLIFLLILNVHLVNSHHLNIYPWLLEPTIAF